MTVETGLEADQMRKFCTDGDRGDYLVKTFSTTSREAEIRICRPNEHGIDTSWCLAPSPYSALPSSPEGALDIHIVFKGGAPPSDRGVLK